MRVAASNGHAPGLGLKWYEYFTGVPNVSDCFPGNSEYLANVQRAMAEYQAFVQQQLNRFQSAGPEAQAFMAESAVQQLLTWCGERNAFSVPTVKAAIIAAADRLVAQEAQRLASGQTPMPPAPVIPGTIPAPLPGTTGISTTTFLPTGMVTSAGEGGRISPGLPGYSETPWWTNVLETMQRPVAGVPLWMLIGGGLVAYLVLRRK